jgi:hypothetical protein
MPIDGEAVLGPLPPGRYSIQLADSLGRVGGTVAEAGPGETRVSVRLAANALVAGRVVSDASGVAVAASGLTVGLIDTGGWRSLSLRSPVTDADGSFLAPAVPAGRYRIEVRGLSADQYVRSVTWDGRDILKDGLELAGRPVSDLEIMLSTGAGTITGVVLDAAGEPAPLAAVVFVPSGEEAYLYREVRAGSDGDFAFEGLTPGDYTLYAWRELDGGAYRNEEFMRPYRALGLPVRIEAEAGEQRIRVRLAGEGSVQK